MGTLRTKRVASLIRAELSEIISRRVKDPRLAGVTINAVDVSPDLRQAKVYFSLWDHERRGQAEAGLKAAAGFLRGELARRLHIKTLPRLIPIYDSSLERGARLDSLIQEARRSDQRAARARDEEESG